MDRRYQRIARMSLILRGLLYALGAFGLGFITFSYATGFVPRDHIGVFATTSGGPSGGTVFFGRGMIKPETRPLPPGGEPWDSFELPLPAPDVSLLTPDGPVFVQSFAVGFNQLRTLLAGMVILLFIFAAVKLERLFATCQRGELFSRATVQHIRTLGWLTLAIGLIQMIATLLPSVEILQFHPALLGLLGPYLLIAFVGLVLIFFAHIVAEGARLADDAAHTV